MKRNNVQRNKEKREENIKKYGGKKPVDVVSGKDDKGLFVTGNKFALRKAIKFDPVVFEGVLESYLKFRDENKLPPTLNGFCIELGISDMTLRDWGKNEEKGFESVSVGIKKIEQHHLDFCDRNGFTMRNPAFAIFQEKARHGFKEVDKKEIDQKVQHNIVIVDYSKKAKPLQSKEVKAVIDV